MSNKVVIFGLSDMAELACYYFSEDTVRDVVAFTVDRDFLPENQLFCGLPVLPFDEITKHYPPSKYDMFVAIGYNN